MEKEKIRLKCREDRKKLNRTIIQELNYVIRQKFLELSELQDARNIMSYISVNNEVDTLSIIKELIKSKKNIYIPYCFPELKAMGISQIYDLNNDIITGYYNIPEPVVKQNGDIYNLDIVIVPGLVFDYNGHRIGYGGGYYDRFLEKLPSHTLTIGLTYNQFLYDKLPEEEHDIPVDIIITEKEILYTGGGSN